MGTPIRCALVCPYSDPADRTPNHRADGVAALLALIGGTSTDTVMVLFRAFPVARPELMDVHLLLYGGAPHRRGGSLSAMIERYQPSDRPASQLLFALRAVAPARVRATNGVACCMSPVASLVRASACSLSGSPQCAGTHWRCSMWPVDSSRCSPLQSRVLRGDI